MNVRSATAADFPSIRTLISAYPEKLMQEHLPEPEEFFVAEENGAVIGCCALEVYSKRLAEIRSLAVREEFQGKGIASELVARCLARAKELSIYEVLTITGTTALFEKQGFGIFNNEKYALFKIVE